MNEKLKTAYRQVASRVPRMGDVDRAIVTARRRRTRRAVGVPIAVALVVVGGASWLSGTTNDSAPEPSDGRPPVAGGDGRADVKVEVSRAEVVRRCTLAYHNLYGPTDVSVELRENDTGPWFEGDEVDVANWTEFPHGQTMEADSCLIPQAGLADTTGTLEVPLPDSDDDGGVRVACGRYLGWDFSGWQVLIADSGDHRLAALFRSTDGYMADCRLDTWYLNDRGSVDWDEFLTDPYRANLPQVEIATEAKLRTERTSGLGDYLIHPQYELNCQREPPGQWVADCLGSGWVSGPEAAARIVITDVVGTQHEIPVVDRWFVFAGTVVNHAAIPEGGCPPAPNVCDDSPGKLHFTVYAADGSILAEYDEDKDLPLST
jgi:hypothetical protein